jgi:hypothetical protein
MSVPVQVRSSITSANIACDARVKVFTLHGLGAQWPPDNELPIECASSHSEACSGQSFTQAQIMDSENYVNGIINWGVEEALLRDLAALKTNVQSLKKPQARHWLDARLIKYGFDRCPEFVRRRLMDRMMQRVYGSGEEMQGTIRIHCVDALIEQLVAQNFRHKFFLRDEVVEAIYWVDPGLIARQDDADTASIIVHDTSFGIVDPKSGYEKLSILATMERAGRSQILLCGVSVSDRTEYFTVMLDLLKEAYPQLAQNERLVVFSDEDTAFLNATKSCLPNAHQFICMWHKKRNVSKRRSGPQGDALEETDGAVA